jgi:uncharacterized protein (DUF885 family)
MRMIRILAVALSALAAACASPAAARQAGDFASILADYQAVEAEADPVSAGRRGDAAALRRWPDPTPAAAAARLRRLQAIERRLERIDPASLSGGAALDRALLAFRLRDDIASAPFDEARIPFISGDGFFTVPDYAAISTTIRSEADAEAWLARLAALPTFYDSNIANMRRGLASGFTQPRLTAERAAASIRSQLAQPPEQSGLLAPLRTLPSSIPAARQSALRAEAARLVRERVRPIQERALAFFERDYGRRTRTSVGISAVPQGRAYYDLLIRRHTTLALTADEIHRIGIEEVARIRSEMEATMRASGFTGDLPAFLTFLRTDRRFYAASIDDYVAAAAEIAKRIDMEVPRYIGRLPRLPFGLRRLPPEVANTSAGYWRGDEASGQSASILIHNERVLRFPLFQLPAWVAHEGVPGHHTQIALSQEIEGLSDFRRDAGITAFTEGWGLYAERLAGEMGIYRTPYERFGQLSYEAWRASRLVVDTGLHAFGWPRERAVAWLRENTALSDLEINNEVDRYIAWPGQALAYKLGEIHITQLRSRAETELGDRFDLRAFHDAVLANGPVTLEMLEQAVNAWIAERK